MGKWTNAIAEKNRQTQQNTVRSSPNIWLCGEIKYFLAMDINALSAVWMLRAD